jgi:hypothetical protein
MAAQAAVRIGRMLLGHAGTLALSPQYLSTNLI